MLQDLLQEQDYAQINAKALAVIKKSFVLTSQKPDIHSRTREEMEEICISDNPNYNISAGDILDIIECCEEGETDTQKLKLLFWLRSFYSMQLYQAYDILTRENDDVGVLAPILMPTKQSVLNLSEYDKLVSGFFINTRISHLMPDMNWESRTSRASRNINFDKLFNLMTEVIDATTNSTSIPSEVINKIKIVEFFLLGISRRSDSKSFISYRNSDPIFYAEPLIYIKKYAYFDIGALLFNLCRIKKCFQRFKYGDEFYKLVFRENIPSLSKGMITQAILDKYGEFDYELNLENEACRNHWLSCCCFRNAEIIEAFKTSLSRFSSPGGSSAAIMSDVFNRMGSFSIPSYDRTGDGYYCINFSFF